VFETVGIRCSGVLIVSVDLVRVIRG